MMVGADNTMELRRTPELIRIISITHTWGAAIAQWIRLRLPSRRPGFESQAHHLRFFHL